MTGAGIPLPPEVVFENTLSFPHLGRDFVQQKLDQKTYEILEVREAEVQKSTYTRSGAEKLELAGKSYNALVVDKLNNKTGVKVKMWLDVENGYLLKAVAPGNRVSYRADPSVVNRIQMANVDENLLAKANVAIADVQAISYMKVKAILEPSGLWVTQEGLNVPGQRFAGTINNNLIEGVFEIEHRRYDGAGAPAFPPDFSKDPSLKKYLEAEEFIESDDPVLVAKAQEITKGSKDSWEAACRLSKWVAENIRYAIPGGATASEIDYVDSGHIRIGVSQSPVTALNPRKMEILDYKAGSARMGQTQEGVPDKYQAYVGEYTNTANKNVVKVFVQGGSLALDIPGKVILALNDPDEKGVWRCKLASQLFLKFDKDRSSKVVEMQLHQIIPVPRKSGPAEANTRVPERFRPYLGTYLLAALPAEFTVLYQDNGLAVYDPLEKKTVRLRLPDKEGRWVDEFDKNAVSFDRDGQGNVTAMNIDSVTRLRR